MNKSRDEVILLIIIIGLALLLRVWLFLNTCLISTDSPAFLSMAKLFAEGKFQEGLHFTYHPFYPLLIAGGGTILGNFEFAGTLVSIILGTLTLIPLFYLGKEIFGTKITLATLFILSIHPLHLRGSSDIMTEGTYIFLFITAIALGWKSLTTNSPYFALLTGLVSALAYLTRPEGICLPVLATFWSGIHLLKSIPTLKRLQILRNVGYLWMVFFILAFPYLLFIRGETGK